jgi:hypothetical protein
MLRSSRSVGLLLAIAALLTICQPASAYIDGGSASYLLQIVFAALFGAAYTLKATCQNVKMAFSRRHHVASIAPDTDPSQSKIA